MLLATAGGQVVSFVHHSLESAETLLWDASTRCRSKAGRPREYQGGQEGTEVMGGRGKGER